MPLPYEWSPGDNMPPPVETECLVTYDAKNLYVAFRAHDPTPADIRAHLMDRDDTDTLIQDDHVGVMIDTFNDERRAFQFRVNPLGVQADAIFSEQDGVEDFSWDMIWNAVGRITGDGYIVEMALPAEAAPVPGRARGADLGLRGVPVVAAQRAPPHLVAAARPQQGVPPLPGEQDHGARGPRPGAQRRAGPDRHLQPHRRARARRTPAR